MQTTSQILMIRPVRFDFNAETAVNNHFQQQQNQNGDIAAKAAQEFDQFVQVLRDAGIMVTVVPDSPEPYTPDSIFPNNWISFHDNGTIFLYPMFALNRRQERKPAVLDTIRSKFTVSDIKDFSHYEQTNRFLEGTGSMVLDRVHKITFACISPRTDASVLNDWCQQAGYRSVAFLATDGAGQPIYHTNVMMCVADRYAVICMDAIPDPAEKALVRSALVGSGKQIITISLEQMNHFAGNMLQVKNVSGQTFLVMSTQAFRSLTPEQVSALETYNPILHADISTIETNGGGSARCMMAEVFLPSA
ncbi:MAG: amidinotransferase [Chitinophagaceae bacterium]|nr:amidinotransferase [Chitinophagaceae bacterium]